MYGNPFKKAAFQGIGAIAFFAVAFFILDNIYTGLYHQNAHGFLAGHAYLPTGFVVFIVAVSAFYGVMLERYLGRSARYLNVALKTQLLFTGLVLLLALIRVIALDGWWQNNFEQFLVNPELFLAVTLLSLLFLPVALFLSLAWGLLRKMKHNGGDVGG